MSLLNGGKVKKTIFILFLLLIPSVLANVNGTDYSVGSSVMGAQGGNALGSLYSARTYLTTNTGGDTQAVNSQSNVGFFGIYRGSPYNSSLNGTKLTTYGSTYIVNISLNQLSSKSITVNQAPKLTLINPLNEVILNNVSMVQSGNDYIYTYTIPLSGELGIWNTNVVSVINSINQNFQDNWTLISCPTEINLYITNSVLPDITAIINITNEGLVDYEYTYYFWVTPRATGEYGDGDTIDSGQSSKLISHGESFIVTKSLTVNTVGTYYFRAKVWYGKWSESSHQFYATNPSGTAGGRGGRRKYYHNSTTKQYKYI